MTTIDQMKSVLKDSGHFKEEDIDQLFTDAHVGRKLRHSSEDDERESDDDEFVFPVTFAGYDRASDDGRCLRCEGWGCDTCDHTGGY